MNQLQNLPSGEAIDKKIHLIIIAVFIVSLKAATEVAATVVGEDVKNVLDNIQIALMILVLAIMGHVAYWKLTKFPKEHRNLFYNPDGFVVEVLRRACAATVSWTFVILSIAGPLAGRRFSDLPGRFFIEGTICFMTALFSLSFLYIYHMGDRDGGEEVG